MDFIYEERHRFKDQVGVFPCTVYLTEVEYTTLKNEARELVGRLYFGRTDRVGPEMIYDMFIVSGAETFGVSLASPQSG